MNDSSYNSQYFEIEDDQVQSTSKTIEGLYNKTSVQGEKDCQYGRNEHGQCEETVWSVDDDTLFYPLGLINHCTDNKSVFLTWSEKYLLNYIFKKSQKSQRTKLTKVRLDVHAEEIIQILILEFNTLILMQSGRVFHFSSVKSMHPFKWLQDVRCISSSEGGFSVIRLIPNNRLHLEVYQDVMNIERSDSTLLQSYDITFDEANVFNCKWEDERFTLLSIVIEEKNVLLLQSIIRLESGKLKDKQEIHIFTVSGNVFALIPESEHNGNGYYIQACATYASNVEFIKVLNERRLFLVFLQCGSIDIWFISNVRQLLKRSTHCTGTQFIHYDFANNDCFYYADTEKVARLKFHYDSSTDTCCVQESSKVIYGILACTWVESVQQLICLSNNNIFYQLGFESNCKEDENIECENLNELYELTPAKMARLMEQAQLLNEWETAPAEIHKSIEQEYVKQELITIGRKSYLYRRLCSANLEFRKYIPTMSSSETIIIHAKTGCTLSANSLFALIYINITKHDIFQSSGCWSLHITNNASGECYVFSIMQEMLHKNVCLVIPIVRHTQTLLPTFQVLLNAFVNIESEFAAISLPFKIGSTPESIEHLFSINQTGLNENYAVYSLSKLIAEFNKKTMGENDERKCLIRKKLQLPEACNFETILNVFKSSNSRNTSEQSLLLYFLSNRFSMSYSLKENCINLESQDAAVLYYVKYYILINLSKHFNEAPENVTDKTDRRKILLQHQAEIERCYGQIKCMDYNDADTLHMENLQRIYYKLRSELCIGLYLH